MRTLGEEAEKQGFDIKVTHRDPKSGQITHKTPYTLRVMGNKSGGRRKLYERPVGSGNCFDGQNRPAGRWIKEEKDGVLSERYEPKAAHIAYEAPMTEDQKLAAQANKAFAENEALKKELAAMKAEQEKKTKVVEKPEAQAATKGTKADGKGA